MATVTNSCALDGIGRLGRTLRAAVQEGPVALLVLRVVDFERIAWREGRGIARDLELRTADAFSAAVKTILRPEDRAAHDLNSDVFVVAMLSQPRGARTPLPADCRAALERVAGCVREASGLRLETGWTMVACRPRGSNLTREIERALERGARERERYEFFATVGHELRTPLTAIRGYLETLLEGNLDGQTRQRFVRTAGREAARLGRLIDGMLDFSLLDLSGDAFAPASCDLAEQIAAACETIAPLAARRGMRLERDVPDHVRVGLGPDSCAHVLINVLDNAAKHGRTGGRIRITCALRSPYAAVRVDDDGAGIATGELRRIFGHRQRGSSAAAEGRGLGLTIVKTIVERAGGEVRATRSPLGGARFELRMPMRAEFPAPPS
jgi:signal transduction histidine kinase